MTFPIFSGKQDVAKRFKTKSSSSVKTASERWLEFAIAKNAFIRVWNNAKLCEKFIYNATQAYFFNYIKSIFLT